MKTNQIWIESVALGTATACALALLIAVLASGTAAVTGRAGSGQANESGSVQANESGSVPPRTYEGMVTCTRCGAKHSAKLARTATNCTLTCVHGGAKFALVDGDKLYPLDGDLNILKRLAGQRARVVGVMRGDAITVSSIADEN
jgi:hypothetical protein